MFVSLHLSSFSWRNTIYKLDIVSHSSPWKDHASGKVYFLDARHSKKNWSNCYEIEFE